MSLLLLFVGAKTASKAAGFVSTGKVGKRWWEELQEEYEQAYDYEDRKKASKAKPAVQARRQARKLAEEAVENGLLDDIGNAAHAAELITALNYARRLDEALKLSRQFKAYIEMLEEQEDEEILLLM